MPAEVANKPPGELRKEVMQLREKLAEAEAAAGRHDVELAAARSALGAQTHAQEARFDDMCEFMEGLLKRLKAENSQLHQQLAEREETDDLLSAEANANGLAAIEEECDEDVEISSPLREARKRRFIFREELCRPSMV